MLSVWGGEAGGKEELTFLHSACRLLPGFFPERCSRARSLGRQGTTPSPTSVSPSPPSSPQASQLGVYRAFVDNYGVAMETAEKCCQANSQFAEISEVMRECPDAAQARALQTPTCVFPLPPWAGC